MEFALDKKARVSVSVERAAAPILQVEIDLGRQESARLDSDRIELLCDDLPPKSLTVDMIGSAITSGDDHIRRSFISAKSDMTQTGAALYWLSIPVPCDASTFQITLPGLTFAAAHLPAQTVRFALRSGRFAVMPGTVM